MPYAKTSWITTDSWRVRRISSTSVLVSFKCIKQPHQMLINAVYTDLVTKIGLRYVYNPFIIEALNHKYSSYCECTINIMSFQCTRPWDLLPRMRNSYACTQRASYYTPTEIIQQMFLCRVNEVCCSNVISTLTKNSEYVKMSRTLID